MICIRPDYENTKMRQSKILLQIEEFSKYQIIFIGEYNRIRILSQFINFRETHILSNYSGYIPDYCDYVIVLDSSHKLQKISEQTRIIRLIWRLICGIFYGITMASPLLLIACTLGMIEQKHIFVLATLGIQLIARLILGFMGTGFSVLEIILLIGVMVWYFLTFMKKMTLVQNTNSANESAGEAVNGKCFCSQCGAECPGQVSFCPKCGNKLRA